LVFLGSVEEFVPPAAGGVPAVCGAAGDAEAAESCLVSVEKEDAAETTKSKTTNTHLSARPMGPEYQGSALAVVDLPNSARIACSASLGGPMRRYCV